MKHDWQRRFWQSAAQCFFGGIGLALTTSFCFRYNVNPSTVALLYLIIIVLVSLRGSFVPSALVSVVAYLCLDSFFTAPLFHPAMSQPPDVVAPIAFCPLRSSSPG